MASTPPPPPPLPPPTPCSKKQPCTTNHKPVPSPQHAAIPFVDPPIQETHPSPEAQGAEAPPVQNGLLSQQSQESSDSDNEEKDRSSQETDTAPQTAAEPGEEATSDGLE
uniref:myc proto-oncogene protein-like isoform X2 n=1 Tax=Monopterus albus TaxID=43700 RepID=UPI0009B36B70|nr:myc proto-oncogene protein-like isoform X2 [Monopterus albus]